jgi:hypothetical protein
MPATSHIAPPAQEAKVYCFFFSKKVLSLLRRTELTAPASASSFQNRPVSFLHTIDRNPTRQHFPGNSVPAIAPKIDKVSAYAE